MTDEVLTPEERAQLYLSKLAQGGVVPTTQPDGLEYAEAIPDEDPYVPSEEDAALDQALAGIDIVNAYNRWCGKSQIAQTNRTESIMISCPNPSHPDTNPSAWINTEKQVYFCGGCQEGGDKFDIAAWHFDYDVPSYKAPGSFPELKRKMAEDFGHVVRRTPGGFTYITEAAPERPERAPLPPEEETTTAAKPVLSLVTQLPDPPDVDFDIPPIVWEDLVPPDTFLADWMRCTQPESLPNEYYFWLGLQAIAFAAGDDAILADFKPVRGNLFLCLTGPSGIGKSRAIGSYVDLLIQSIPYDYSDVDSKGVMLVPSPGSPEALIDSFSIPVFDPSDPKKILRYAATRGLVQFHELSTLMGRAARHGSPFKPTLMEFFDSYGDVTLRTRGAGRIIAHRPFCQVITTTQIKSIRDLLTQADADSGFANRWVFALGHQKRRVSYGGVELDLSVAVGSLRGTKAFAAMRHRYLLEDEVLAKWDEFFHEVVTPVQDNDDDGMTLRVDLLLKKLILLFCVNEKVSQPTEDLLDRVLSLWDYLRSMYLGLSTQIGVGDFESCRMELARVVAQHEAKTTLAPTARDIGRYMPKRFPRDLVSKVLKVMIELGEIEELITKPKVGRPSTRYHCVG